MNNTKSKLPENLQKTKHQEKITKNIRNWIYTIYMGLEDFHLTDNTTIDASIIN